MPTMYLVWKWPLFQGYNSEQEKEGPSFKRTYIPV